MRFPKKTVIVLLLLSGAFATFTWLSAYWRGRNQPRYREAAVTRGPIVAVVNATGTVQPVLSVSVGSFVSGPIKALHVDFNDIVTKDQLLAEIDPLIYEAAVAQADAAKAQAMALLATRQGELKSAIALMQQAKNDEERSLALQKVDKSFIADTEIDKFKYTSQSLQAQVVVVEANIKQAEANIRQAEANLKTANANLGYTQIRAPVDGIVINRKIDPGQTVAAQFQTPEMFIVAPDMKKKMYIIATVDESDIGMITTAKLRKLPVHFTVDAYPTDLFEGQIFQIRMSSTTTQNVVTYPVVVETANPDLKLLPGMTASLSFQVDDVQKTLRIPNSAVRFYPQRDQVRPEDRKLLEGTQLDAPDDDAPQTKLAAKDKAQGRKDTHKRHVWVVEGASLRAIEVVTGLSDSKYTQLLTGELAEGQKLVIGTQTGE